MKVGLGIEWRLAAIMLSIYAAVAGLIHCLFGAPFWLSFGGIAGAFIANGFLAEWEDHQPGGFYNPTEDQIARKKSVGRRPSRVGVGGSLL